MLRHCTKDKKNKVFSTVFCFKYNPTLLYYGCRMLDLMVWACDLKNVTTLHIQALRKTVGIPLITVYIFDSKFLRSDILKLHTLHTLFKKIEVISNSITT